MPVENQNQNVSVSVCCATADRDRDAETEKALYPVFPIRPGVRVSSGSIGEMAAADDTSDHATCERQRDSRERECHDMPAHDSTGQHSALTVTGTWVFLTKTSRSSS